MFDSEESRVNRSHGLKKEKKGTFKNLGLVTEQCNGITACAYSLKIFTVQAGLAMPDNCLFQKIKPFSEVKLKI